MMTHALSEELDAALLRCAAEEIHLIGRMQGRHVLMAIDPATDRFTYLSENAGDLLGLTTAGLWRVAASGFFGDLQLELLLGKALASPGREAFLEEIPMARGTAHLAWVYASEGNLVIEISPVQECATKDPDLWAWENAMRDSLTRIDLSKGLDAKLFTVVDEVARVGAFDRVMIYRFHDDSSGEVVAERIRKGLEPYLGLRYPASDIPPQARKLFLRNEVRMICKVSAPPVTIIGSPERPVAALDLSLSRFRQPSPIHLEYLSNMGVAASFVSAILVEGTLWGLISCHHGAELELSFARQAHLGAISRHFASNLSALAAERRLRNELDCARIASKLIQCIAVTDDWTTVLMSMGEEICQLLKSDGLCLRFGEIRRSFGSVPSEETADALISRGLVKGEGLSFSSSRNGDSLEGEAWPGNIGGFLVIPLSCFQGDALVFFRKEQTSDVVWAGNPEKQLSSTATGARLEPRSSFLAWKESSKGTCEPWSENDLNLAAAIRITLSDIVITAHYFRQSLESVSTIRFRLAHEMNSGPVVIANESGIVVYRNPAALQDPFFQNLQSLDLLAHRIAPDDGPEIARSFHSLVHHGEDIGVSIRLVDGHPQWLEGKRLLEDGRLMGYSIRVLKKGREPGTRAATEDLPT